jgi:hypothetical protein
LQVIPKISEEEEVWRRKIGRVWRAYGDRQPIFRPKSATFLSRVRACIVCINNEVSLASLWAKPDEFREHIVTMVFCIKTPALWKNLDQVKPQCIPCNCHPDFLVLNGMISLFRGFLIWSKPDLLTIRGKIEPRLIESEKKVPALIFD